MDVSFTRGVRGAFESRVVSLSRVVVRVLFGRLWRFPERERDRETPERCCLCALCSLRNVWCWKEYARRSTNCLYYKSLFLHITIDWQERGGGDQQQQHAGGRKTTIITWVFSRTFRNRRNWRDSSATRRRKRTRATGPTMMRKERRRRRKEKSR